MVTWIDVKAEIRMIKRLLKNEIGGHGANSLFLKYEKDITFVENCKIAPRYGDSTGGLFHVHLNENDDLHYRGKIIFCDGKLFRVVKTLIDAFSHTMLCQVIKGDMAKDDANVTVIDDEKCGFSSIKGRGDMICGQFKYDIDVGQTVLFDKNLYRVIGIGCSSNLGGEVKSYELAVRGI